MPADAALLAQRRAECAQRAVELGMLLADCADHDQPLPEGLEGRRDEMIDALEAALHVLARTNGTLARLEERRAARGN